MPMRKDSKNSKKSRTSKEKTEEESIGKGTGTFNFPNGDKYEGEYIIVNKNEIYRHGYGVYRTNDFDEYRATWENDSISSNLHIIYSNKAEYRGEIDADGAMSGRGTYVYPDGSSLTATWTDNEPVADFVYSDPLGQVWRVKSKNERDIILAPDTRVTKKDTLTLGCE